MIFFATALAATLSMCPASPYGLPSNTNNSLQLCHPGYYTQYNTSKYDPEIVIWQITPDTAISCGERQGNFHQDTLADNKDASPSDYVGSGYDKGHMADAADFTFDAKEEVDTFSMTNMTPQLPGLNRGGWKWLETMSRVYAIKYNKVVVFSGPVFGTDDGRLNNHIDVPKYFWKVIYIPSLNKALSILVPNDNIRGKDILNYIVSVNKIESEIGIKIPLPTNYDKTITEDKSNWIEKFSILTNSTKQKCQKN